MNAPTAPGPPVVEVELHRVVLALRQPHASAGGIEAERDIVLVRVVLEDGTEGWGECPTLSLPTYSSEHAAGAWLVLRDELVPAVLAGRPASVVGHPMAKAAVADALLDARLRTRGRSLAAHLGVTARRVSTTTVVARVGSVAEVLEVVAGAPGGVKVKIEPGFDLEPLAAVRACWPERWLAADANGSFAADQIDRLTAVDALGLAYLEQPCPGLAGAAVAARALSTPVCVDEAADSLDAVRAAVDLEAMAVLNVKPARLGGVEVAAAAVALAAEAGIDAFVGGMLETGVGRRAALAVAGLAGCTLPTDLGPSARYFSADLTDPVEEGTDASLAIPTGPGIGPAPDPGRLEAATRDRWVGRR